MINELDNNTTSLSSIERFRVKWGNNKKCSYQHKYNNYKCDLKVTPSHKKSVCILHDPNPDKDKAIFDKTLNAFINNCLAEKVRIHLEGVVFVGNIQLTRRKIDQDIYFNDSTFLGRTSFSNTTFERSVNFRSCKFNEVHFDSTSFCGETRFYTVLFYGITIFHFTNFDTTSNYIHFINVRFLKPDLVVIMGSLLSKVLFCGTNLEKINFVNVKWPKSTESGRLRPVIADELYYLDLPKYRLCHLYYQSFHSMDITKEVQDELKQKKKQFETKEFENKIKLTKFILISKNLPLKYFPLKKKVFRHSLKTIKRVLRL